MTPAPGDYISRFVHRDGSIAVALEAAEVEPSFVLAGETTPAAWEGIHSEEKNDGHQRRA